MNKTIITVSALVVLFSSAIFFYSNIEKPTETANAVLTVEPELAKEEEIVEVKAAASIAVATVAEPAKEPVVPKVQPSNPPSSTSAPQRLKIPSIGVNAFVEQMGLTSQGAMDAPAGPDNAGWYKLGTKPGEVGSAVIDGHSGWKGDIPAIFDNLGNVQVGDKIYVENGDGNTVTFVVRRIKEYPFNADAGEIFHSNDGLSHLNLITCAGTWNDISRSSSMRLVVFADKL